MFSLYTDKLLVSNNYRCKDIDLINYIQSLELKSAPTLENFRAKYTISELEQILSSKFPQYVFSFKCKHIKPSKINTVTVPKDKDYFICDLVDNLKDYSKMFR